MTSSHSIPRRTAHDPMRILRERLQHGLIRHAVGRHAESHEPRLRPRRDRQRLDGAPVAREHRQVVHLEATPRGIGLLHPRLQRAEGRWAVGRQLPCHARTTAILSGEFGAALGPALHLGTAPRCPRILEPVRGEHRPRASIGRAAERTDALPAADDRPHRVVDGAHPVVDAHLHVRAELAQRAGVRAVGRQILHEPLTDVSAAVHDDDIKKRRICRHVPRREQAAQQRPLLAHGPRGVEASFTANCQGHGITPAAERALRVAQALQGNLLHRGADPFLLPVGNEVL